jgi:hypothetical protein
MADRDGGICLFQKVRNRFADNITTTENNGSLPFEIHLGFL